MAKAVNTYYTDAERWRCKEQTGLDTLVVYTVNDDCYRGVYKNAFIKETASSLPGHYGRKTKI